MDFPSAISEVFIRKKMVRDSCRLLGADKMVHYLILYAMNSKRRASDCAGEQSRSREHDPGAYACALCRICAHADGSCSCVKTLEQRFSCCWLGLMRPKHAPLIAVWIQWLDREPPAG